MTWRPACFVLLFSLASAWAEKPTLDGLFPAGAAAGSSNTVTLFGKFDPWPPKIWFGGEGLACEFETNKGKLHLSVAAEAKPGPRLLRLYNADGASEVRFFTIGQGREELEREPNDHFRKAQLVTNTPVTINGRLEKNGDVDSFAFEVRAGEWLDARLDSYTLMSKLDPVLRLLSTNGYQLAWNHDFGSLDPRLIWRSPKDQTVVLQVFGFVYPANAEIQLSGGAGGFYRLNLATSTASPIVSCSETKTNLAVGDTVSGVICPAGDQDRYSITLKKDQWIDLRVAAYAIGSPLDPWLSMEDSSGKELARNDDSDNTRDPHLEWKAPSDGNFFVTLGSVSRNAREDFRYELSVRELYPAFAARISEDNIVLAAGSTNSVKVTIQRLRGFTNALSASFDNLPEGISSGVITNESKGAEIAVPLIASSDAPSWNGPVKLIIKDLATSEDSFAKFDLVSRSENNGVPGGYLKLATDSIEHLWLTVRPAEKK